MTDHETDLRLRRTYGIGLDDYNLILASQGGGCAICGKVPEPGKPRLHTDHSHKFKHFKVLTVRAGVLWRVWVAEIPELYVTATDKREAVRILRNTLKRKSVRGILCWKCNRALRVWNDNPDLMRSGADYLIRFANAVGLTSVKKECYNGTTK